MILNSVYLRFYKSFNYDYLRKFSRTTSTKEYPWESMEGNWYPHVRVLLDSRITSIVGENESGKTCLLDAIESAITGKNIQRRNFCRHSTFFSSQAGKSYLPQFGTEWTGLSEQESDQLADVSAGKAPEKIERFWLFRTQSDQADLYFDNTQENPPHTVSGEELSSLTDLLPHVFRIKSRIGLPSSVPISYLAGKREQAGEFVHWPISKLVALARQLVHEHDRLRDPQKNEDWIKSLAAATKAESSETTQELREDELKLAHDLVRKIARNEPTELALLQTELDNGQHQYAENIVHQLNHQIRRTLNFPRFWQQDKRFQLVLSLLNHELVLGIRDRTNRKYSFDERSDGLRYFLSYYIQYLAHDRQPDRSEILLMDEPDRYLSRQGQQDLLKIFDGYAFPDPPDRPIQVVYVTHSPFLIDKNHVQRLRVLQKGKDDEGTRVVRNASRNHYEPLRSSFGAFVAETAFIGNCNIMVEGLADQVLIAGASRYLGTGSPDSKTLDLNKVTLIPTGGAGEMPYLTFLARGRDVERPLVLALLDSDPAGNAAKQTLTKGVAISSKRKPLLDESDILQIGDVYPEGSDTEDLVPIAIALEAMRRYVADYLGWEREKRESFTLESLETLVDENENSVFRAVRAAVKAEDQAVRIEKVGFARSVVQVLEDPTETARDALPEFRDRMQLLFARLNEMRRRAERRRAVDKIDARIEGLKNQFRDDHPRGATREDAILLFEPMEDLLDNSKEGRATRRIIDHARERFALGGDEISTPIDNYDEFLSELDRIQYAGMVDSQQNDQEERAD